METLVGSKTQRREGESGPIDPRKTSVKLGDEKVLYRTSSQNDMVDHFGDKRQSELRQTEKITVSVLFGLKIKMGLN